jgi:hypothetical protein
MPEHFLCCFLSKFSFFLLIAWTMLLLCFVLYCFVLNCVLCVEIFHYYLLQFFIAPFALKAVCFFTEVSNIHRFYLFPFSSLEPLKNGENDFSAEYGS